MLFRYRLKALREDADLTQQELADKLHTTRPTISNYENTDREPSYDVLIKIADYFNVSLDYLLCRTNIRIPFSELYKDLKTK
ncbi:TPA: helix-turn-helix domain-containing protein [Clostridium sporogenes]